MFVAGCTLVSKSAGFSIPLTYLTSTILSFLISCILLSFRLKVVLNLELTVMFLLKGEQNVLSSKAGHVACY